MKRVLLGLLGLLIIGAVFIANNDIQNIPLTQWLADVFKIHRNIAINEAIEKSPISVPGYNQQQLQRLAAVTAIYDRANKLPFDHFITNTSYVTDPVTEQEKAEFKKILSQGWEINSKGQVYKTFNWLKNEGHQQLFMMMAEALNAGQANKELAENGADPETKNRIQVVQDNYKQLGKNGIIAWDLVRLAYIAQISYYAGYITREEAWKEIIYTAKTTQQDFASWDEMANSFLVGREFWNGEKDKEFSDIATWLLTNEHSPWKTNKWDLSLSKAPQ